MSNGQLSMNSFFGVLAQPRPMKNMENKMTSFPGSLPAATVCAYIVRDVPQRVLDTKLFAVPPPSSDDQAWWDGPGKF